MTVAGTGAVSAPPRSRVFGLHVELALAFSLLPVVRIWDLTDDLNTAASTAALFAGAAWLIWRLSAEQPPRSSRSARIAVGVMLALAAWQLAWIDSDDFWFYRVALNVWSVSWLLLWWGWPGLIRGWRVLAAFALWSLMCGDPWRWMHASVQEGVGLAPAAAAATAQSSAWLLRLLGHPAVARGNHLFAFHEPVTVGLTCTSLPLTKLLLLLLVLAALVLRLSWLRAAAVALAAAAIAYVTAVIRVAILAAVGSDPERFHYWHEPNTGGQWFTAVAMIATAALFWRALPSTRPADVRTEEDPPNFGRGIAVAAVLMLLAGRLTLPPPPAPHFVNAAGSGYTLASDGSESTGDGPLGFFRANEPTWIRRITYQSSSGARLEMTLAYVPQMLAGNLRPEAGSWSLDAGGKFACLRTPGRRVWVSTIAPDGYAVATAAGWDRKVDEGLNHPSRWTQWLAHRRPLRDKRAYWAEAIWTGRPGQEPPVPPVPFSHWIGLTAPGPAAAAAPPA